MTQVTRRTIYKDYSEFAQNYDDKSIDDLCRGTANFELQVQQKFFQKLVKDHPDLKELLLYHQIGSGKTLTSIIIAEEHMKRDSELKVLVIVPARLKSNFYNELMYFSAYGNIDEYCNAQEYSMYVATNTSRKIKKEIFNRFLEKVSRKYTIISFERFRLDTIKSRKPKEHLMRLCRNKVVIIDEIHNLISFSYKADHLNMIESNILPRGRIPGVNTLFLKTMVRFASDSTRFVFLTATPVFDKVREFSEVVKIMNPDMNIVEKVGQKAGIYKLMPLLAGKVSYFPGTSPAAYPSVSYINHDVTPSTFQMNMCKFIRPIMFTDEDPNNSFFSLERRASIFAFIDNNDIDMIEDKEIPDAYKKSFKEVLPLALRNPERYMNKIKVLIDTVESLQGKQIIYSNFIQYGVNLAAELLKARGWTDIREVLNGKVANPENYKCFARWDGLTKNSEKDAIKSLANSVENLDGKLLRVVIGSPAMKEGVSFKHIQDYHILDPVWNQSTKTQIEGRAIRFCSHYDIPVDHPYLRRHVSVHIYKLKYPGQQTVTLDDNTSVDVFIYDSLIPSKHNSVSKSEAALRKVAFDYYLFRKLYRNASKNKSTPSLDSKESKFSLTESNNLVHLKNKEVKVKRKKNTCLPKSRLPPCKNGYEERDNKYGQKCCYKLKRVHKAV